MIVILKPDSPKPKVDALLATLKSKGVDIHFSEGNIPPCSALWEILQKINQQALEAVDICSRSQADFGTLQVGQPQIPQR